MGATLISISRVIGVTNVNAPRRADAPIPEASIYLQTCLVCIIRMDTNHALEFSQVSRFILHNVVKGFP